MTSDLRRNRRVSWVSALREVRTAGDLSTCLSAMVRAVSMVGRGGAMALAFGGDVPIAAAGFPPARSEVYDLTEFPTAERVIRGFAEGLAPNQDGVVYRVPASDVLQISQCPLYRALLEFHDAPERRRTPGATFESRELVGTTLDSHGVLDDVRVTTRESADERVGHWSSAKSRSTADFNVREEEQTETSPRDYLYLPVWREPIESAGEWRSPHRDLLAVVVLDCDEYTSRDPEVNEQLAWIAEATSVALGRFPTDLSKQAQHALSANDFRHSVLKHLPVGVIIHSDFTIRYLSQPLVELLNGQSPDDFVGKPVREILSPCQREFAFRVMSSVYASREATGWVNTRMLRADGTILDVEIFGTPIEYQGVPAYQTVVVDVTERNREAAWMSRKQSEVAYFDRMRMIGEMVVEIVHELTQPVSAVANYSGACQTLLRKYVTETEGETSNEVLHLESLEDQQRLATWLKALSSAAGRVGEQMEQLRAFVRRNQPIRHSIRLAEAIEESVRLASRVAAQQHIEVEVLPFDNEMLVAVDPVQIEQVVFNLLSNAIDATSLAKRDSGSDANKVQLQVKNLPQGVSVSIHDTGTGVLPRIQERMFEPFFSTKPQGMGMGLTISQRIIEGHGGKLRLERSTDAGSTFTFTLELAEPA